MWESIRPGGGRMAAFAVAAFVVLAGCGATQQQTSQPSLNPTGTPTATATAIATATTPATASATTTPVSTGTVAFTDGAWTTGSATLTVSGNGGGTWQAPLVAAQSATLAGVTTLQFTEQDAVMDVTLVIHGSDVLLNAATVAGGITAGMATDTACTTTYDSATQSAIEATVTCPNALSITSSGDSQRRDVEVSFSASR